MLNSSKDWNPPKKNKHLWWLKSPTPSSNDHEEQEAHHDGHHDGHHNDGQVGGPCEDQNTQEDAAQRDAKRDQSTIQNHLTGWCFLMSEDAKLIQKNQIHLLETYPKIKILKPEPNSQQLSPGFHLLFPYNWFPNPLRKLPFQPSQLRSCSKVWMHAMHLWWKPPLGYWRPGLTGQWYQWYRFCFKNM